MNLWWLVLAGIAAGAINSVVGSGSLITFPLLIAAGMPPVVANATNTVGVTPGGILGAWGYRRELAARSRPIAGIVAVMLSGSILGTLLVVRLPATVFTLVVPWLILLAVALVLVQPAITRALAMRESPPQSRRIWSGIAGCGVYSGYFGAALGIMLMAVLATTYDSNLQRSNALKNLLAGLANGVSAVVFTLSGLVRWPEGLAIAAGAGVGGLIGAPFARRLPDRLLRLLLAATGIVAAVVTFARA